MAVFSAIGLVASGFASRCSSDEKKKLDESWLVGEWEGKLIVAEAKMNEKVYGGKLDDEMVRESAAEIQRQVDMIQITMTFKENGTWITKTSGPGVAAKDQSKSGKWKVVKIERQTIKIKMTDDDEKTKDEEHTYLFSNRKSFVMQIDEFVFPQFTKK